MTVVRMMGVFTLLAVLVVIFAAPEASASRAQPQAKFTWGVVTGTLYLNKSETVKLSVGAGAVAAIGAVLPPPFDIILLASGTLVSAKAAWAAADGKCLKIKSYGAIDSYGPKTKNVGRYCR